MARLGLVASCCWVLIAILVGGAIIYGQTRPERDDFQTLGLDICSGRPCFRSVIPEITSWDETASLLKDRLTQLSSVDMIFYFGPHKQARAIRSGTSVSTISYGDYQGKPLLPRLYRFIEKFGVPCRVLLPVSPDVLILTYPHMELTVIVNFETNRLNQNSLVQDISLGIVDPISVDNSCERLPRRDFIVAPWLGFSSLDVYRKRSLQTITD